MRDEMDDLYQKDILGSLAVHNLAVQQAELNRLRQVISEGDAKAIARYLERSVKDQRGFRKFAYQLIEENIQPYFDEAQYA